MKNQVQLTKAIDPISNSLNRSAWRRRFLFIPLVVGCVAFSPSARADCEQGCDGGNTFLGEDALQSNTSGPFNTANGYQALFSNTSGGQNTANGALALDNNISGWSNTATGAYALDLNTTGDSNTATGAFALFLNETGDDNTASGTSALRSNTTGSFNTANGVSALNKNITGNSNTANGYQALYSNTSGGDNTANGSNALYSNTTGSSNTANGKSALFRNIKGSGNTAIGFVALYNNTTQSAFVERSGDNNTAVGNNALYGNIVGDNNIALGVSAGTNITGSNNIDIGNVGVALESNAIRIGTAGTHSNTYIAAISGVAVAGGVGVIVDSAGHLGTVVSSARFKDAIQPMDKASEAILALQPVTFRYNQELDPEGILQFGLVAEEVEKVNPALVARDDQGKAFTVRYEAVNAMLLNEFLKAHRKLEEQARINQQQGATITRLEAALKEQTTQIQKVSEQLSGNKPAPRFVATTGPKKHPKEKT